MYWFYKNLFKLLIAIAIFGLSCSRSSNDNLTYNEEHSHTFIHGDKNVYSQNPWLTDEYLESRKKGRDFIYYIIDTLYIENAVWLSYKKGEFQLDMITSYDVISEIDFSQAIMPWYLLSKSNIYIQGIGGSNHQFLSNYAKTTELPEPAIEQGSTIYSEHYVGRPLLQKMFLLVIIDEATYILTEAVLGHNAPITAHIVGLPIKMVYPLEKN